MNLVETVLQPHIRACNKHALDSDPQAYAERKVESMTNMQLLEAVQFALIELGVLPDCE